MLYTYSTLWSVALNGVVLLNWELSQNAQQYILYDRKKGQLISILKKTT